MIYVKVQKWPITQMTISQTPDFTQKNCYISLHIATQPCQFMAQNSDGEGGGGTWTQHIWSSQIC